MTTRRCDGYELATLPGVSFCRKDGARVVHELMQERDAIRAEKARAREDGWRAGVEAAAKAASDGADPQGRAVQRAIKRIRALIPPAAHETARDVDSPEVRAEVLAKWGPPVVRVAETAPVVASTDASRAEDDYDALRAKAEAFIMGGEPVSGVLAWDRLAATTQSEENKALVREARRIGRGNSGGDMSMRIGGATQVMIPGPAGSRQEVARGHAAPVEGVGSTPTLEQCAACEGRGWFVAAYATFNCPDCGGSGRRR